MKNRSVWNVVIWISMLYFVTIVLLIFLHESENNVQNNLDIVGDDIILIHNEISQSKQVAEVTAVSDVVEQIDRVQKFLRYGPGENGSDVNLAGLNISFPGLAERNKKHDFNTFISDMISLHRKMPDMRPQDCKDKVYPDDMPPITVVTIFRDEWWSILLRTVYSVLEMSPPHLIYEVIIVDDGSNDTDLITRVKLHANNLDKVRFIQNKVPRGLMMARQTGIDAVRSDLFIVMDGHMEVGPGWLEPLIYRLIQQPKALLCSHIGGIHQEHFGIRISNNNPEEKLYDTVFPFFDHASLDQMFAPYKQDYRNYRNQSVEPIPYGTIQGMMMVMRKKLFDELGGFDPGMQIWGSEQMELSVKVWMCGGVVEMIPCSTVAHMYRITPWGGLKEKEDYHALNKARMSKVWMDSPYSDPLTKYLSDKNYTLGDLSSRHDIRTRNKCKPYKYFVDQVKSFSDVYIPFDVKQQGNIKNQLFDRCLDIAKEEGQTKLILYPCHEKIASNQNYLHTETGQIRGREGFLLDVTKNENDANLYLRNSPGEWTGQESVWKYENYTLVNIYTGFCLTALTQDTLGVKPCIDSKTQRWNWGNEQ